MDMDNQGMEMDGRGQQKSCPYKALIIITAAAIICGQTNEALA